MKNRKTIIFDFDGTIANTEEVLLSIINRLSSEFGYKKITKKDINKFKNQTALSVFKSWGIPLIKLPLIIRKSRQLLHQEIEMVPLKKDIANTLQKLKNKGHQLGILTSNSKENTEKFLKKHKLQIFTFIHSEKNIFGKDKALKHLLKHHNLNLDEVVYVGDEVRDIDSCKKAGVKIIAVTWGFNGKEILVKHQPDYLIENPSDLLKILNIQ